MVVQICHPPSWPRNHLLLVQRPGRQPFSKRHAQARNAGASHLFSFLVLSTAVIHNGYSKILRAWIYAGYHAPVITTTASQSCRAHFNFTLYILHNLLSRIMETRKPYLHHLRCRLFHNSARACYSFFSFRKCSIAKKTANKANPSVGRLSTEMKRKM